MSLLKFLGQAGVVFGLLFSHTACVDPDSGTSVNGTALYVFDSASGTVNVWDDASTLYTNLSSSTATTPTRTITGSLITSNIKTPAVGGVCFDINAKRLFLVDADGAVVRIERANKQSGTLSSQADIASFTLDSASRLSSGTFGQAAVDSQSGTLYVTETNSTQTRIWVVASPGNYGGTGQQTTVSLVSLATGSIDTLIGGPDKGGTGVAVSLGSVYAYFSDGSAVPSPLGVGNNYTGARLRSGTSSAFSAHVIIGPDTTLDDTGSGGCLALDTGNNFLYVLRSSANAASLGLIAVFHTADFTSGYDQAPTRFLGSATGQPNLRIIAHGGNKDWLGGAAYSGSAFSNKVWLWKNPSLGGDPVLLTVGASATVPGFAFDGSN